MVEAECPAEAPITDSVLLGQWTGPYGGVPPFDKADPATFEADLTRGMDLAMAEMETLINNPEPATFSNTIKAMECGGGALDRAFAIYGVYSSNLSDDKIRAINVSMSPKFSAFSDKISQNPKLFARVKTVYENMDKEGLNAQQRRLVEDSYKGFVRSGANLSDEDKAAMSKLNTRLSELTTKFGQNTQHDEEAYVTYITDKKDLAGLPTGSCHRWQTKPKA